MRWVPVLFWHRICAGCSTPIDVGARAYEVDELRGILFHEPLCRALYACAQMAAEMNRRFDRLFSVSKLTPGFNAKLPSI